MSSCARRTTSRSTRCSATSRATSSRSSRCRRCCRTISRRWPPTSPTPGKLADFIASSLATIGTAIKQEILATLDIRARMDSLNRILIKELEVLELGSKIQSQVQSEVGKNQREYFLREQLKAIQKELGEGDEQAKEIEELRAKIEGVGHARRREEGSAPRARSAVEDAGRRGGIHGFAHLPRLGRGAALVQAHRRLHRPEAHEGRARRGPLRPREGEGPRPRVPRRPEAESGRQGTDPVLPRPSRSRQDLARQVDCQFARPEVRPGIARRHARRGGDPRPPPHLHRRAARAGHPGPAPRRVEESGLHPRRDRQARLGLPRRPGLGAARSPRPRAEQHVPRSLSRRAVRSLGSAVPHHGERARSRFRRRCATGWRCSSSPATPKRKSSRSPSST